MKSRDVGKDSGSRKRSHSDWFCLPGCCKPALQMPAGEAALAWGGSGGGL